MSLGLVSYGGIADAGETSHYKNHGVLFSYDNRLKVKESKEEKTITITLEGYEDLLLMIQVMDIPFLSGEDYAESLVKGMRDGMASSGAEATKVQKTSRGIAQKKEKAIPLITPSLGLHSVTLPMAITLLGKRLRCQSSIQSKTKKKSSRLLKQ